jgi:hypothetical protein
MTGQNCHGVTFFVLQIQDVARDHSEILVSGENENAKKSKILVAEAQEEVGGETCPQRWNQMFRRVRVFVGNTRLSLASMKTARPHK